MVIGEYFLSSGPYFIYIKCMTKSLSVSSDPHSLLCIVTRGGGALKYWGCATGQGTFLELPALACVIIIIG